jgi:8-oxo-dGTP pyrophosphatase MutT (NUDIX family)
VTIPREGSTTPIRDAATVLVARDSTEGLEVFMVRRNARSAWLPQIYVFPGGAVDAADREAASHAQLRGSAGEVDPAFVVTAARETFEEGGLLFADRPIAPQALSEARRALLAKEITFADVLSRFDAAIDASHLRFFSRWITPPMEVRRFDARFFVGRVPHDQIAEADALEVLDGRWFRPLEALAAFERKEIGMIFPTVKHLERIAPYHTVAELMVFAAAKRIATVEPEYSGGELALPAEVVDAW